MYLQITTKCNMKCSHCCYSCNKNGKHMEWNVFCQSITFAREWDEETISIGGGEPTLHPRFFDILKMCLEDFNYVWMATNGSKTKIMWRLYNILLNQDFQSFAYSEDEGYYDNPDYIYQENKLSVALSTDYYHDYDLVDYKIRDAWERKVREKAPGFECRDITKSYSGVIKSGRAIRENVWKTEKDCVCSELFIRTDGRIKLCGCRKSPIIGDVWSGIEEKWEDIIQNDVGYNDTNCYSGINGEREE